MYDSEETISRLSRYFDPKATPKDFVTWLASWLSLDLYELLGAKNREFILRAVEVYKQKGTVSGIARLVSFLTGRKCCVKEYKNNIFRTYGMEHYGVEEIADEHDCTKFYREMSRTVNTANRDLIINMDTFYDEVHYVTDTSETGKYSPHVIGLFIFLVEGEKELKDEEELRRIIRSFLPVFVRAVIIPVEVPFEEIIDINRVIDEYEDSIHTELGEEFKEVGGVYNGVNWNWLCTYKDASKGRTNDLLYRTPHGKIGGVITL
jgi:phage tail-like protein